MFTATKDDTVQNLKNSAQNLKSMANEAVADSGESLRDAANKAGRKARNLYNSACDELAHARDTVTSEIRTKPVQSSFIALGAGVLLGMLMRRR